MLAAVPKSLPNCLLLCCPYLHCQCRAGKHRVVFLEKGPFILVMASATNEPESALLGQLGLVHGQILSILTNSVEKMFAKNPSYDVRKLLGECSHASYVCCLYDNKCSPKPEHITPYHTLSTPHPMSQLPYQDLLCCAFLFCPALPCPALPCPALPYI